MPVATGAGATPTPRMQSERFTKLTTAMVIAIPLTSFPLIHLRLCDAIPSLKVVMQ